MVSSPRSVLLVCVSSVWCSTLGRAQETRPPALRPLAEVRKAAARIDELVEQGLAAANLRAEPIVDDATLVRRAWLTLAGRIPSAAEAQGFLDDPAGDKRERLCDALLLSPGHQSHEFNWWADLLRARGRLMRQTSGEPFLHWIKESIAARTPYDAMVREMLTAEGAAHERGHGATGYLLRDAGMPLDSMANTLRVFTGTRLECAQCHNHPFDKWKQKDFFGMAAFFGGLRYQSGFERSTQGAELRQTAMALLGDAVAGKAQQAQQVMRRIFQTLSEGLGGSGTGFTRLPKDYKYPDSKPNDPVVARTLFGASVVLDVTPPGARRPTPQRKNPARAAPADPGAREVHSREVFARWLTAPDNPRFAQVIANRMWKRVMGRGLIEPVDDLREDTQASVPALLQHLTALMVELRFDLVEFERVLVHTKLFQRAAPAHELETGKPWLAGGPLLLRMSAEQLWDSLLTLVLPDLDQHLMPAGARAEEIYRRYEQLAKGSPEELKAELQNELLRVTDPQKFRQLQTERARARIVEQAEKQREARPLLRELAGARRKGDEAEVQRLMQRLRELGVAIPGDRRPGADGGLVRASDLPQPAPPGHFLRQLGASDRETVDAANREANVPQVLSLLNGATLALIWLGMEDAFAENNDG